MKSKKGFTLLEILLVIASIGLLAAIVIVAINPTRQLAQVRDGERIVELRSLNDALSQYSIDNNGSFPAGLSNTYIEICAEGAADCTDKVDLDALVPDYLSSIPADPSNVDANGTSYFVRVENGRVVTRAPDSEQDVIGINKELDEEYGGLFVWGDNQYGQMGLGTRNVQLAEQEFAVGNTWVDMDVDLYHGVAIDDNGGLYTWGYNEYGQLGDGTVNFSDAPERVGTDTWTDADAGYYHTLAIRSDGTLWGWGNNFFGQVGDGSTTTRNAPVQIAAGSWSQVSAGAFHSVAVRSDGALFAWGSNQSGALGDGTTTNRTTPVVINSGTAYASASAGYEHTLGIRQSGNRLWAWGLNANGALGDGTVTQRNAPVAIGTAAWSQVEAGSLYSMGIQTSGNLYGWGLNSTAQLGDGTVTQRNAPVQIGSSTWQSVSVSFQHSVGINSSGNKFAWGMNDFGNYGNGTTASSLSPVQIGIDEWDIAVAGYSMSVGQKTSGAIGTYASGYSMHGQLGDGNILGSAEPVFLRGAVFQDVTFGSNFAMAIDIEGNLWSWGWGSAGTLGHGNTNSYFIPIRVGTSKWKDVDAGDTHVLAIRSDDTLWAWGQNTQGELGLGDLVARTTPTQVSAASWESVSAGGRTSFAIRTDGTLWAWGDNNQAQLGAGLTYAGTDQNVPRQVGTDTDWAQVNGESIHANAIKDNGTLWTWGYDFYEQLGIANGPYGQFHVDPQQVGINTWIDVDGSDSHTTAIASDNTLWAWGNNSDYNLGDGTRTTRAVPTQISASNIWTDVTSSDLHNGAITTGGDLYTWGRGPFGQLGNGDFYFHTTPTLVDNTNNWAQIEFYDANSIGIFDTE